ncbi:hypothetical protein CEXT_279651 [Caerostris extrusa]|uniref:Uncharacterized protein n=1 Tax=Caerostris extrusa TaxID=172846 RepID=A0AAV4X412_CAEEX|nr:hypothetical protein CEXT_279651 [Caerostris extrusa]
MTLRKLWLVVSVFSLVESCYKFPENVKDPCEEKECHFGAQCRPSLDGTTGGVRVSRKMCHVWRQQGFTSSMRKRWTRLPKPV